MRFLDLKHPAKEFFPVAGCGLCLGHFDGVHIGHRALIDRLKEMAAESKENLPLGVLLFKEPPAVALMKEPTPQITTLEEKLTLLKKAGLRFAVICDFPEIMNYSPAEFVNKILLEYCHCKLLCCGFNYSFGKGGKGKPADLKELFEKEGRKLSVVTEVSAAGRTVSSSVIREMLENGCPENATRLMGHPFTVSGIVRRGKQLGRQMQFPTANLRFPQWGLIPACGVYAVRAEVGNCTYNGICNVGRRPTFEDGDFVNCETFLFDFSGNLYRRRLVVSLLYFLRHEKKFENMEELAAQISTDIKKAEELLQ